MKPRGFALAQLALVLGILLAVAGIVVAVRGYLEGIREEADKAGYTRAVAEVAARDNKKLAAALKRVQELEADKAKREETMQAAVDAAVAQKSKEARDATRNLETLRAGLRNGTFSLRDPGAKTRPGCPGSGERPATAIAGDPAGSSGRVGGGELRGEGEGVLSVEAGEFIVAEAGRADAKVRALQICRATLKAERLP